MYDSAFPSKIHGVFAHPSFYLKWYAITLSIAFPSLLVFACLPRRPALPADSLICLPVVALLIACSLDKEKQ